MKTLARVLVLSVIFSTAMASAKQIYLGQVNLLDQKDTDVINLPRCMGPGKNALVSQLRFHVKKYGAEIDRLQVVFQNGGRQELMVREHFPKGSSSRWIDLAGPRRCIKRIVVTGDTDSFWNDNRRQSKILFYGR
jgi:hypothetical protein